MALVGADCTAGLVAENCIVDADCTAGLVAEDCIVVSDFEQQIYPVQDVAAAVPTYFPRYLLSAK